ncbi:WGR domain-containing protein [Streptomyces yaanensis]|uniref:WGR domain-containing protein n=1 Tax=Streptomyces yaanensis TaxID=1142239 RepID=A0ABV7ST11_9ACTN|nr:WGR domain-containing protein [Streptomyces sp. CGMCC 4.7035]WNB97386.1 WGR domain-containing protein [Streptomyces sp. CGMCC 4.7035]
MSGWRRFERQGATLEYWEIRQEGIRCFIRWGSDPAPGKASTSVLDDEERARCHAARKINDRLRKGFAEVDPPRDPAEADVGTPVLDVITRATGPHSPIPQYLPVDGFDQVYRRTHASDHPMGFYEYYVLRDNGRGAVRFTVRAGSHKADTVASFLEFLCSRRDLAFDGRSHHKLPLPSPVGSFDHALFCSPALGRACAAYPAAAARVATAFPVFNCEIGDEDAEVLVDARIHGHGALPYSDWGRRPQPVVDLRFDVQPSFYRRTQTFKVYRPADLQKLMDVLSQASPQSWVEVRSFRGETTRLAPGTLPHFADLLSFLTN